VAILVVLEIISREVLPIPDRFAMGFTEQALGRVIMWAMIMPVTVVIMAVMKRRADRASDEIVRRECVAKIAASRS